MSSTLEIQDVILAVQSRVVDSGYTKIDSQMHAKIIVEFEVVKTDCCVIDYGRGKAISIDTGEVYDIVKRDASGRILFDIVNSKEIVALRLLEKDWKQVSLACQIELKRSAQRVYDAYLANLTEPEKQVCLTKKRKGNN